MQNILDESEIRVVAAVICDHDHWLLGRRPAHKRHGQLWEFPGGKLEPGESLMAAATRELAEELDLVVIEIGRCLYRIQDRGSPFVIEFTETIVKGVPRALEHEAIGWFSLSQLATLALAPSDHAFVREWLNRHG